MISRILAIITVASGCLLAVLLFTTNPGNVGPAGLLGVFVLGYLSLLGVVTFLLFYTTKLGKFLFQAVGRRTIRNEMTLRRAYLYASVIATLPMMLIGLYSTGGVNWYEVLLIGLFGIIGVTYVARRT